MAQSIEALGKNSKVLAEGNLAISNTIANYLDRQERIVSAKELDQLNSVQNKVTLEADFNQQYHTLENELKGFERTEARLLKISFSQFNQFDDDLFLLKKQILQLEKTVESKTSSVISMIDRTRTYANSLARKVKIDEKEKTKEAKQYNVDKELLNLFGILNTEPQKTEMMSNKKERKRATEALVDKNTKGKQTKSLISLHLSNLERATHKMLLAIDSAALENIKTSEVDPELKNLNTRLKKIKNIKITVEDYDKIITAIHDDVARLSQELTGKTHSLYASSQSLIMQRDQFESLKKQLDQSRSELLMHLEQLNQSGDRIADRTKSNATAVVNKSRNYILGVGLSILLIFLLVGHAISKRINAMAEAIKAQSDQTAKANRELQESNELITDSIRYGNKIQRAIQSFEHEFDTFFQDFFVIWQPRDIVGGDLYLLRAWGNGKLVLFADCTGHGVPGAFMTILSKSALDKALRMVPPGRTGQLITAMHQIIQSDLGQNTDDSIADDGLDLGICYISENKKKLTFSGARLPLIYRTTTGIKELKGEKSSIGYRGIESDITFSEHHLELDQETDFYLFTDGIVDQVGGDKTISFGRQRLLKLIEDVANQKMSDQKNVFLNELACYQGTEDRRDDVTMIGFTLIPD